MKTWKWLVIILTIALLAVYYVLGTDFLKQRRQNTALSSQKAEMAAVLAMLPDTSADLEQQLADARAEHITAESSFSGNTNDTQIVNNILRLAQETGVKAIPLLTRPWSTESIYNHDYSVFYLTLSVTGNLNHVQNFIDRLENSSLPTMVIRYLKIERDATTTGVAVQADIDVAVYVLATAED